MTTTMRYHLAQLNVARARFEMDDPRMKDFADALDPVNAIADGSPGFVWRLQSDEGNATDIRPTDDHLFMVNMSVWDDCESLMAFVRNELHLSFLKRRAEWFEKPDAPILVLWWVPAGHTPTVTEALERLNELRSRGPSPTAFDVRTLYPPPRQSEG